MGDSSPDGLMGLANAFAEFVRRARRAPLTRRERDQLIAYIKDNAHHIAPPPESKVVQRDERGSVAWKDLGYR